MYVYRYMYIYLERSKHGFTSIRFWTHFHLILRLWHPKAPLRRLATGRPPRPDLRRNLCRSYLVSTVTSINTYRIYIYIYLYVYMYIYCMYIYIYVILNLYIYIIYILNKSIYIHKWFIIYIYIYTLYITYYKWYILKQ